LIYLQAPGIAAKTLKHMSAAATSEDQIHYLFHLRTLPIGQWTMDQRKEYLNYFLVDRSKLAHVPNIIGWFADVGRPYTNGASHANFFRNFFREAAMNMSDAERAELAPMIALIDKNAVPTYDVPPRKLVKEWQMGELEPMLTRVDKGRNFAKGRQAYFAGQCIKCHRFGEEGGAVGPELTVIANRFTRRDMLESILDPSKVISDQYENSVIETSAGKIVTGRVVDESADRVVIQPDPLSPQRIDIPKKEIESRTASKVSPMPSHLADVLTPEEILDLIAFMESGGRADYRAFR